MEAVKEKQQLQKHPAYKDSGVEWLGEVPEHWGLRRFKYLFKELNERSVDGTEDLLSVSQYTGVTRKGDKIEEGDLLTNASSLEGYKKVQKGDLVTNIMLAWNGSLGFSPFEGITSPAYSIYRLQGNNEERFFHYLLRTDRYKAEFKRNSSGVIESRLRLYSDDFFRILSLLPPKEEQSAIANFLDEKCGKIDTAIAQKQQLIELLKERKQIIIQNAVTKGLKPEVKMKDSRVEWIGEIPGHWEVKALKHIAQLESGQTISSESFILEGYPVYGGNGFRGYAKTYTNEGEHVLIGRQGALCGNVNYASGTFFASEHAIVVYHKDDVNILWLGEAIRVADFNRLSQSAAQPGIAVNVIKNVLFPFPPPTEQAEIANNLTNQFLKFEETIDLQEKQIEKLKEYKSSLIDAVVTGKVKVS
ncbi:restriction endonuclease subunit S [Salegentibacter sp. JZCK2]|uniref:restriction endonuclease subunit S n=1 Tax=Salegentibacter tibetensis TaxID=2873600 RepID=UPI001CCAC061|nr:restriction endonuclease subunit S [Salegentibacter tibetensis]MBZ9730386.1 restriction endonuclease subunit S [Salegentibacter tibetensis]